MVGHFYVCLMMFCTRLQRNPRLQAIIAAPPNVGQSIALTKTDMDHLKTKPVPLAPAESHAAAQKTSTEAFAAPFLLNAALQRTAVASYLGLFCLCVLWEIWLAPLKPGGTLLFLKALPLAFAVRGVVRGSLYTIQWASMLVLLYLMEGVVRVMSDPPGPSISLAWIEIALASVFFFSSIFYVRPAKRAAKALQKAEKLKQ
jgi:uncharacterized membrane protein